MEPDLITLRDGRKLAYAEYGKAGGIPVFYFHGTPGSHILPDRDINVGARYGLRLICPVRPGFGRSDFQPERRFLDWPDDVVELANYLGINRFGVISFSGGGPYALACSYKIPDYLTKVVVVSSLAPLDLMGIKLEPKSHAQRITEATAMLEGLTTDPDKWLDEIIADASIDDKARLAELGSWLVTNFQEALCNGVEGLVREYELFENYPWGFTLHDVSASVYIWHGDADTAVSVEHGQYLAENIHNCMATFVPGGTHLLEEHEATYGIFARENTD